MRRCSSSEVGSYVLELAGVIMGVAVFIVGAADLTRIFQARSAVRAAVNDGARCLFPSDGACVDRTSTGLSAPSHSYDVWVWGSGYEVPQESYVLSARWREEPVYEVQALQDEIATVTVERQPFQYRPYSMRYPVTAHTAYLLQTRFLPVVVGGTPLDPQFADPFTNALVRPTRTSGLQGVRGATTQTVTSALKTPYNEVLKIGSVSFSVRDAWPTMEGDRKEIAVMPSGMATSLLCLFGARTSSASGEALNWEAGTPQGCRYRVRSSRSSPVMQGGTLKVPMMFRVEGDTRGTVEGAQGKVMMALAWESPSAGSGRVELGGRAIGYLGSGHFVPRGLAEVDINAALRSQYGDYKEELSLYYELPLLPVDATVTLEFYLMSSNGRRVAWNGARLGVWLPQYRLVHEQRECGYAADPSLCSRPPASVPIHYLSMSDGAPFLAAVNGEDSCARDEEPLAERDLSAVIARLRDQFARTGVAAPYSFKLTVPPDQSLCPPKIETTPCVAPLTEYLAGCESSVPLDEVAARCSIASRSTKVLSYTKRPLARSVKRVRGCSDRPLPQCAVSNARKVASISYGGEGACDVAATSNVPQTIIGPLDATTCLAREGDLERLYRRQEKIPVDVAISVVRFPASSRFSAEPPGNSCIPYSSAAGGTREMICGRGLTSLAADRCCTASDGRCRKVTVVAASDPSRGEALKGLLSAAQRRVIEATQAGYPPAQHQEVCEASDPNCLDVSTALSENETKAIVSAKVQVPLMMLRPFGSELVTVEHSTTRVLERTG